MKGPPTNDTPPSRRGKLLHDLQQAAGKRSKPRTKPKRARFDAFVARYYPTVYSFAFRLTDDPREAVLLAHDAFLSIPKQLWRRRDGIAVAILLNAMIRAVATETGWAQLVAAKAGP
jgi:hypothetical protein